MKPVDIEGDPKIDSHLVELEAKDFQKALIFTVDYFTEFKEEINELNVFPVPDGDTGTNMYLTLSKAVDNIRDLETDSVAEVLDELAAGALLGGRGNSGVIFSQLLRGMAEAITDQQKVGAEELAEGLERAAQKAYQGVMKPVEGTILTVAREVAQRAQKVVQQEKEIGVFLKAIVEQAEQSVAQTPQQLSALAEAGVVDAGAKGYAVFWEGIYNYYLLKNEEVEPYVASESPKTDPEKKVTVDSSVESEYHYCTEFVLRGAEVNCKEVTELLQSQGDSLLVVEGQDFIKVHLHTNQPGAVLSQGLELGMLSQIKIDNMVEEQHQNELVEATQEVAVTEEAEIAVVAVANGPGLVDILTDLGVEQVIAGGQSNNPSTQDFVAAIEELEASEVVLLPNNSNIISAAEQAVEISEKEVKLLPTTSIPQGIAAMLGFNPRGDLVQVAEQMLAESQEIKSGAVTYAVRDSVVEGEEISQDDVLGLIEGEIEVVNNSSEQVLVELLESLLEPEDFLITVYVGEEISEEEAEQLEERLGESFAELEVELYRGGQPLYYYLVSVE
ncbi:DAK2 domain-containing protein [Fuchsiella alkaliacetigena]|uniref:DAK2 domain-containing protein n=1 Tax=Fuchsiella alkaliacetigena TaxID=957042 RepID=UPI00200AE5C9|nr:DAK2 domain-containing protein [Fuchsiella alkaliacetigena]MCK8823603.1 DAK2 domain-containing protein [Fuchsiella alkaliacetigena]